LSFLLRGGEKCGTLRYASDCDKAGTKRRHSILGVHAESPWTFARTRQSPWLTQRHVLALTVLDTTDSSIIRIVLDDPEKARDLLQQHGFAFTESTLVSWK